MAKAQATRNGQPTPKLDKKIEKMKAMMGSTIQKVPAANHLPASSWTTRVSTSCPCRVAPALEIRFALNCSSHGKNRIIE